MSKAEISRVDYTYKGKPPVPSASMVDTGRKYINTGNPILHWEVEVNSLDDLARIAQEADGERLIIEFDSSGVSCITIYDDYME